MSEAAQGEVRPLDLAVIGLAGRFPGARDAEALWTLLAEGREGITRFTDEQLLANGVAADLLSNPGYVKAGSLLADVDAFDAGFFGVPADYARVLDPQQRLFLEHSWHALEDAGYDPHRFDGLIGAFAGTDMSTYMFNNVLARPDIVASVAPLQIGLANDKDSIATRVAYLMDLRGPAFTVQSYCSTSLVAVCTAASSLIQGECDMALAGGVSITIPHGVGYLYVDDGMQSPDGRCRAYDVDTEGTPMGDGVGVVVLRRLADALAAGDHIRAVIRGWAVTNDGALKVGYTAPGVRGQSAVVAEAIAAAGVDPATIDYVEGHGTGTPLGDSVEIAGLQRVFPAGHRLKIGSIKTNLGHLNHAAGVTGLIKTVMSLEHRAIPATLNFTNPNPQLLAPAVLDVVSELTPWPATEHAPRAGVSAFGIGGTNAHVVLEAAPAPPDRSDRPRRDHHLLVWSGRTEEALAGLTDSLRGYLGSGTAAPIEDVAFTQQAGRAVFGHRRALVTGSADAAAAALADPARGGVLSRFEALSERPVGLLIAGVGEQYPGIAGRLYDTEPAFRDRIDSYRAALSELIGTDPVAALVGPRRPVNGSGPVDLRALLGRAERTDDPEAAALARTEVLQPALFVLWYALAETLREWGLAPATMLGYSLGEYVTACLAGVLSFPDALRLVAYRAELISRMPAGAMAAVGLGEQALRAAIDRSGLPLDVAGVNGAQMTVLAGAPGDVDRLLDTLAGAEVATRRLETTHAFHSRLLAGAADDLTGWVSANVMLHAPAVPYLSNVTGRPITAAEATDPGYWARHMCSTVRFADAVGALLAQRDLALVEIGPGQSLGGMVRTHPACDTNRWASIVATLPAAADGRAADAVLAEGIGRLWLAGVRIDWTAYHGRHPVRRAPLPRYPFSRERHWLDRPDWSVTPATDAPATSATGAPAAAATSTPAAPPAAPATWLRAPVWRRSDPTPTPAAGHLLVFTDERGAGAALASAVAGDGTRVTLVRHGGSLSTDGPQWTVRAASPADHEQALRAITGPPVTGVVHLWGLDADDLASAREFGFDSVAATVRAVGEAGLTGAPILVVTANAEAVRDGDVPTPEAALATGPTLVASQEYPGLVARRVDLPGPGADGWAEQAGRALRAEVYLPPTDPAVAYRDGRRFIRAYDVLLAPVPAAPEPATAAGGVYLITGGLGAVGLMLADHFGRHGAAAIVVTGRSAFPDRSEWDTIRADAPDSPVAAAIGRVRAVEAGGSTVAVERVDVTDVAAMRALVASIRERFGRLDGVVHAAAATGPGGFSPVATLEPATGDLQFAPKLAGTLALEQVLADEPIEFCLLFSSISAILGGLGFAAYAAANAFLDAIVHRNRAAGRPWTAVNWDTWAPTAANLSATGLGAAQVQNSFPVEAGMAMFDAAVALRVPRVVAGVGDLDARIAEWGVGAAEEPAAEQAPRRPRPDLPQEFVPPSSTLERRLAALWSATLGVDGVGTEDNFFDLGGTSLLGVQLLRAIRKQLGVAVPAIALFEASTVGALAAYIGPDVELKPAEPAAAGRPAPPVVRPEVASVAPAEPTGAVPTAPGHPGPEPAGPGPTGLEPAGLEPAGLEPTGLEPTGLEPTGLEPIGLGPTRLGPTAAEPAGAGPAGLGPAGAAPAGLAVAEPAVPAGGPGTATPRSEPAGPGGTERSRDVDGIAIIGMAGRFPGANSTDELWRNLVGGVESIRFFSDEELLAGGVSPAQLTEPNYVHARPVLDDIRSFDAAFFGYSPREASITDPQQRIFLECCWEALEHAGYGAPAGRGRVGVFGAKNISTYMMGGMAQMFAAGTVSTSQVIVGNMQDSLATVVSYRLDLTGPAFSVQTFCSSSLVAVHLAVRSLYDAECEVALAGGVSLQVPDKIGYYYQPGGQESPDGHIRTFDAQAGGSLFGDGSAVVVLKPLAAARRDGDTVYAVIRGSAINNDGARKVGYTAPSMGGQVRVITDALAAARVAPEDVAFIEAHGTATELGDPVEVAALTRAFATERRQYCAIGSVKPNIGHLDRAAGASGLIKATLALHHGLLPPTLHYTSPNPEIDFENSPFFVNTEPLPLRPAPGRPLIAGVSSLGQGGTNVHAVLQQAPPPASRPALPARSRRTVLLPVSARSAAAADEACRRLAAHLDANLDVNLDANLDGDPDGDPDGDGDAGLRDAAWTLQVGRQRFRHRRVAVAVTAGEAVAALRGAGTGTTRLVERSEAVRDRRVAFVFGDTAPVRAGLLHELAAREPAVAKALGSIRAAAADLVGTDVIGLLIGDPSSSAALAATLPATLPAEAGVADLASFAAAWATATLLRSWAFEPVAVLGVGLGELVAACLAGVLSPEHALAAVVERARLLADGGADRGRAGQALADWLVTNVTLDPPRLPFVPTAARTGPGVGSAAYWRGHLATPPQLADAMRAVAADGDIAFVTFAPAAGPDEPDLVRAAATGCPGSEVVTALPGPDDARPDDVVLATALAQLWAAGVVVDWAAVARDLAKGKPWQPRRVALPTYPFERADHWLPEPPQDAAPAAGPDAGPDAGNAAAYGELPRLEPRDWLFAPVWRQTLFAPAGEETGNWLVFTDDGRPQQLLAGVLTRLAPATCVLIRPGAGFGVTAGGYTVRPGSAEDLGLVIQAVLGAGLTIDRVVHLWGTADAVGDIAAETDRGYHSVVGLAQAMADAACDEWQLDIVTAGGQLVLPTDALAPARALPVGPARLIPVEYPRVRARLIDLGSADTTGSAAAGLARELSAPPADQLVAIRGRTRWTPEYERLPLPAEPEPGQPGAGADAAAQAAGGAGAARPDGPARPAADWTAGAFVDEGVYLVTGGLGGIGLAMAERLARDHRARIVLFGRTGLPPADDWPAVLAAEAEDSDLRRRISGVQAIRASGGEVEIVTGDVGVDADVEAAVARAVDRFGRLDGVLHVAGLPGVGLMQFKSRQDAERVLAPKVLGPLAIERAIRAVPGLDVDTLVLFSSVTSATGGGPGQVDYCSANAFLDAYARDAATRQVARRVVSIGWGEWTWDAWSAGLTGYDTVMQDLFRSNRARFGIDFDDGWRTVRRAVAAGESHLVASTQDFAVLARSSGQLNVDLIRSVSGDKDAVRYPRPDLSVPYVEPRTEVEETIAELWASSLGLDRVGVLDRFFELGGNSLVGVDLVARIRRKLGLSQLPPHVLYEAPTVAAFAEYVAGGGGTDEDEEAARRRSRAARRQASHRPAGAGR